MSKTTKISIRCLHCRKWFPSPLWFDQSESFDTSKLFANQAQCPHCKKLTGCNKDNFLALFEDGGFLGNKAVDKTEEKKEITIINDESLKRVYANFISVAKTPYEFNLTFCCIDPLDDKGARTVAKIAIPISIVENVLKEMEEEFKNPKKPSSSAGVFFSKESVY